jgi:quercetin dioxygenase-like cupin family protein
MIRRVTEIQSERREGMRGGSGVGWARTYVGAGEMQGIAFVTEMTLEPGTSIGVHVHDNDEELYLVLEGKGEGTLDEQRFAVVAGDAWVCRRGHRHGIVADAAQPLRFLGVLSRGG